jgi:drug/metabolite transporter (DMT)-like permease
MSGNMRRAGSRPRWQGVALIMLIASTFGANHIAARAAFDHGTGIVTAIICRSAGTASIVLILMRLAGKPLSLPRGALGKAIIVGLLVTGQSLCLYSAVAIIPVGLALLSFNVFPFLLALMTWVVDRRRPSTRTLVLMPLALFGLSLALNLQGPNAATEWTQKGTGILFAFGAAGFFATALLLTQRWLADVDGRMRTLVMAGTILISVGLLGGFVGRFAWPTDTTGWAGLATLTVLYSLAFTGLFTVLPRFGILDNAAVMNFEPVAALILGVLILDQTITAIQMAGVAVVLASMIGFASASRNT